MGGTSERAPFSCYTVRTQRPSQADVQKVLAQALDSWRHLIRHLEETYDLKGSLHYMYGRRYGWAFRFQRGGRLMLALYPNQGCLTVQVILGAAQVQAALKMKLSSLISTVLRSAKNYPEGRWLFIPVKSMAGAQSLKPVIALKIAGSRGKAIPDYQKGSVRHHSLESPLR